MERELERIDNRYMSRKHHMVSKFCAAAILCSSGGVLAQTIYRQLDSSGVITFTDRPVVDGVVEPHLKLSDQPGGSISLPRAVNGNRSDVADALARNAGMSSTYAATVDFNEAKRRLQQARESRREGLEPEPGELAGSSSSGAMHKRYQSRQQRLRREVVAAERRSLETSLVQRALLIRLMARQESK
jgi:hypothetical protein